MQQRVLRASQMHNSMKAVGANCPRGEFAHGVAVGCTPFGIATTVLRLPACVF